MLRQWILTASVLTAAALILRLVFHKRISQRLQYALWLPVLLRLLLPFALFSAPVSVPAAAERLAPAVFAAPASRPETVLPTPYPSRPPAVSAAPIVPSGETAELRPAATPAPAEPVSSPVPARTLDWPRLLRFVWLDGSLVLALWLLGVNLGFWNKLRRSRTLFREGKTPVYVSESVASPCLFGLFRPAVYLTPEAAELPETQLEQVLLHERTHLRQGDPIWGLLRCLCLAVWWWNPLVWLAAACSRRDGELSCDEKVLRTLGEDKRLEYGHTLVDLLPRKTPGALLCTATISGGGRDMKERLERIVKKPRLWIAAAVIAVLLTALIVGCSFAGKGEEETAGPSPSAAPTPSVTAAPTQTATPISNWQEQYRELLRRLLEDETLYEPIGGGPVLSFELLDLSGNGIPELVLYFHGAEQTHAAAVVTLEEGELRCMNRELTLGLPPAENAVDRLFIANPGVYESEVGRNAFFRYYCQTDDGDGRIGEGFYLLDSASGVECESWGDWILFGHDERGYLRCETRLSWELHCDLESFAEVYWEIDGEETSAEEYHAAMDAFDAWLGQYRLLIKTGATCVVFRDEADPMAAVDRALAGWTPLPAAAPTQTATPISNWQEQYRELVEKAMEADYPYVEWGNGPIQAMALMDLSGNGTPELALFFPGGGKSDAAVVVTVEEGELRCLNRDNPLGLPPSANAVGERAFNANPGKTAVQEDFPACFRYYCAADDRGNILEGFYLLDSGNGTSGERWCSWLVFGQDARGCLTCETRLTTDLAWDEDAQGTRETRWAINGQECTAEEYHAAEDAFLSWRDQYRYLAGTWERSCVVFRDEADPMAAVRRTLGAWTPLPAAVPASMALFTPVTEAMGQDWLTLPEGAVWLTEEELKEWEDWFAADWMRGQFLTSAYERPKDVDLHELFYIGVDTEEETGAEYFEKNLNPITPEDKRAYLLHLGDWMTECPTDKLPRAQMETVLQKYLGLSLEETKRVRLSFSYLPETDAYYHSHGDTNYRGTPRLLYGYVRGDEIALFFPGEAMDFSPEYRLGYDTKYGVYRVVLRREGEEIRFRSNLLALTNGAEAYYDPPRIGSSVPANETGDYGRDVTRFQRQYMAEAPEAADTWEYPGYGTLKYAEEGESVCLWFETVDEERWLLPTPQMAAGKLPMVRTGDGYTEGKGFVLVSGEDRDLITWSMQCPEQTILAGNTVRQGGFARWTVYLPTMETFVYFSPDEDRQDDALQAGTDEWLERIFGGAESLSVELADAAGLSRTVDIPMDSCRICLRSCAWTGPYGPGADTPETEYTLTLRGGGGELVLYQGSTLGRLYLEGEETRYDILASGTYPNSNRSPADLFRRQVFDQAEYREALEAIRIDAWEENVGEAFLLELCEAEMKLFPGSTYGLRDYRILRVKQLPISGAEDTELAVGLEYALVPNEWNCVRWWSGSGCDVGEGEYEGWLIERLYARLVLEDGAWRWAEFASGGGWSNEIIMEMLEPAPEPTSEPTPAPTPEPAAYEPVTLEMWTDWLTLPEGARWLTQEELDEWTAWFNADWMRWSFLTSAYARPQDVDLGALFYTGVDLRESSTRDYSQNAVTGKDLRYYLLHRGTFEHDIDLDKLPRVQMDDLLRKYLGIGLEETNKIGLWFPYFPETDAYYHLHGDTNWGPFPLRYGFAVGDEVCLFNLSTWNHGQFSATGYNNGGEGIYRTVLRTEGDSVRFVSNLRALTNGTDAAYDVPWQNDAYPDGYAEEERDVTVITLIPEVYESAEAAREYVESLGFNIVYNSGSENEYTEKAYPIEILFEQVCPGYGTLIYGEIPTGTIHGSNPFMWFISTGGRLYRLPMPMGMANIRLEREGLYRADEGRGIRFLDSRSDMLRWWMRLTQEINQETNLYISSDSWTGGENKIVSSGSATWTLYLPTMEVFLLYEPEG